MAPNLTTFLFGVRIVFQVISWDDLSVNCYWICGIKKKAVAPNARKIRRKVHHPKGAIHQCYNTNGWTKDVQSACWKNYQEMSYIRVNQHSILRLGDSSSNGFIWLLFSLSGSVPHLWSVNARLKRGKASHKQKLACLVYGCFLKWWHPQNTPRWSFLVGKPMVVGYHHFRKPPYNDWTMISWCTALPEEKTSSFLQLGGKNLQQIQIDLPGHPT